MAKLFVPFDISTIDNVPIISQSGHVITGPGEASSVTGCYLPIGREAGGEWQTTTKLPNSLSVFFATTTASPTRLRLDLIVIISTPGWTISRRTFLAVSRERLSYGQLLGNSTPGRPASRRQTSWAQEITSFRRLSVRGLSARSPLYYWLQLMLSWLPFSQPLSHRHFTDNALGKAAFNMWKCILIWVWSWAMNSFEI